MLAWRNGIRRRFKPSYMWVRIPPLAPEREEMVVVRVLCPENKMAPTWANTLGKAEKGKDQARCTKCGNLHTMTRLEK